VLAALSAATVGAVVASRRPSHPVGWLLLGLGLSLPWSDVLDGYVDYGRLARPGSLPAARPRRAAGTGGPEPSAPRQWPSW
jgi:hypothetical protein